MMGVFLAAQKMVSQLTIFLDKAQHLAAEKTLTQVSIFLLRHAAEVFEAAKSSSQLEDLIPTKVNIFLDKAMHLAAAPKMSTQVDIFLDKARYDCGGPSTRRPRTQTCKRRRSWSRSRSRPAEPSHVKLAVAPSDRQAGPTGPTAGPDLEPHGLPWPVARLGGDTWHIGPCRPRSSRDFGSARNRRIAGASPTGPVGRRTPTT
jgi:hypothetical protein